MPSPLGHALAGLATAWGADAVSGRPPSARPLVVGWGGSLTAWCILLATLPDLDLLFHAHRSFTHSVTAAVLVLIIAVAVTGRVTRGRRWRIAITCAVAYGTHLLLDWLATDTCFPYGIQALWPFSHEWFISGWNLFPQTERLRLFSRSTIETNLIAMAWEAAILVPIVAVVGLVRVKTLAGLPAKVASSHETAQ
jgi:inner membrane protein